MHATWNILLKTAGDPLRTATVGMLAAFGVLAPVVAVGWLVLGPVAIPPQAVLIGFLSGLAEIAYFVFLAAAYRRGDLSIVSPLARGSAPVLIVLIGVLIIVTSGTTDGLKLLVSQFDFSKGVGLRVMVNHLCICSIFSCLY